MVWMDVAAAGGCSRVVHTGHPLPSLRSLTQPDDHPDGVAQGVAQVLRLGRALRAPADDADLPYPLEGGGQPVEQVPTAAHDGLVLSAEGHVLLVENSS